MKAKEQRQTDAAFRFGPYRLDVGNAQLWRETQEVKLTGKALAVLRYLVEHPGQLATKDNLFAAVWAGTVVSEATLASCILELRHALRDDAKQPRYIETVHRRGYRFLPAVTAQPVASSQRGGTTQKATGKQQKGTRETRSSPLNSHHPPLPLVGRETDLRCLQTWLAKALTGARQLVFVTGEAGVGKTTVVDAFVNRLRAENTVWIGQGQCIEHYGSGEAYLPVLDALGRLCREPDGNQLIALLAQHAPTWLVQMPVLLTTTDLEALQRRTHGATRERMLRELAEALEVLTTERPLVLVLEDLHWSDVSTVDWLAFVARRREPARLLILGAYRPVEVIVNNHSLKSVKQELHLHGQCVELPLPFLTEEQVTTYLEKRFASPLPASAGKEGKGLASATLHTLAQLIHQRTEGNPLFMVNLVDYLVTQGVLALSEGEWRLQGDVTAIESWAPESLQQMIEKQIERLSPTAKLVLEAASVVGAEFSAAAVAAGAATTIEEVEEHSAGLARREQFLQARGTVEWPDGTVAARYGFLHVLYQDVLYGRLTARQQQRLHRQIGERVEQAYGERAKEIAAELAMHFERGREYRKAIQYLHQAGKTALQRSAHQEAFDHFTKGLELLKALPDTPEQTQQELRLQLALGPPLVATKGYAAPEVERVCTRALELCRQLGETPRLFWALEGLWAFYLMRAEHKTAREMAEQYLSLAQNVHNPIFLMRIQLIQGDTLFWLGEFAQAREHLEAGIAFYDPQQHPYGTVEDPRVTCLCYAAWSLWFLGYPDHALQRIHVALTLAQELSHPFSLAYALVVAATLHQLRQEVQAVQERAEAAMTLSTEQGFPHWLALGTIRRGWVLAEQGQVEEGITQMRQGMVAERAIGAEMGRPSILALLAEAYGRRGQVEEGLAVLAEALALVDKTGERYYEAELYRLKGQLMLQQERQQAKGNGQQKNVTDPRSLMPDAQGEAEACFHSAIEVARKQQAKSLELRAVMSVSRLWQQQGRATEAHQLLSDIYK